jgi:hypothetical protein
MKWIAVREGYKKAVVGPLFAYIEGNGGHRVPDHPDHEPERFNWFIAPDDEDKNHRRALVEGSAESMDSAKEDVELALHQIVVLMREDIATIAKPDDENAIVYDEVLGLMRRLARTDVPDEVVAKVLFAFGVKALLREGYVIDEIQPLVVEVANLRPERRGKA